MAENGNVRGGQPFAFGEHGAVSALTLEQAQEMFTEAPQVGTEEASKAANGEIRRPAGLDQPSTPEK